MSRKRERGFGGRVLEAILAASAGGDAAELESFCHRAAVLAAEYLNAGDVEQARACAADYEWLTQLLAKALVPGLFSDGATE